MKKIAKPMTLVTPAARTPVASRPVRCAP